MEGTPALGGLMGEGIAAGRGIIGEPAGAGARTGFGGRLIIAVSRGLEATGCPSRRAGSTIRTVSFFGSAIKSQGGLIGYSQADTNIHKFPMQCQ